MALIAVDAVVDVAGDATVPRVRLRLGMAVRALEHRIVARIRVACGAHTVGVPMIHIEPGVIKRRSQPTGGRVTCLAGGWEPSRDVVWIRCCGVLGLVARIAIGRSTNKDAADVATVARHVYMESREWEWRVVVIEGRIQPRRCRMAHGAVLRVTTSHVIRDSRRRRRLVVVHCVAAVAGGWQRAFVVVRVTGGAGYAHMRAGQREYRRTMIEFRIKPIHRRVAHRAVLREIGAHMIGDARHRRRIVVIFRVAAVASRRCVRVISADMTLRALQISVPVRQREKWSMVETGRVPASSRVAGRTCRCRKSRLGVRRIVCGVVCRQVA